MSANMSGRDTPQKFSAGQLRALAALLTGSTAEEAAAKADVSLRTLRRWQALPEFQELLRESARASLREADSLILAAGREAVTTLWKVMRTGSTAEQIRAALGLLDLGHKVAADDLDERLHRLEEAWHTGQHEPIGQPELRILSS
jgi:G:T/U-mismatch repair DNA glycosylase